MPHFPLKWQLGYELLVAFLDNVMIVCGNCWLTVVNTKIMLYGMYFFSKIVEHSFRVFIYQVTVLLCCFPRLKEHHQQQTIMIERSMLPTWMHYMI